VVEQALAKLRGELGGVGQDTFEVPVSADEPGRRLVTHAGHARQVVGGVAAKGGKQRVRARGHAVTLGDTRLVVDDGVRDPLAGVHDLHVGILDELERVAVTGHHHHVAAGVASLGRERGQDVVGFVAHLLHARHGEDPEHLAHESELGNQEVRRLGPVSLVVRDHLVAKGRLGPVEGHGDAARVVVAQQVHENGTEPEHSVCHLPTGRRQIGRERKESAKDQRVPIEEEERPAAGHVRQPTALGLRR
jgi:hypothetical protein